MSDSNLLDQAYQWSGRFDKEDNKKGKRWHYSFKKNTGFDQPGNKDVALIGYCCDAGVSNNKGRIGAKNGPNAIRDALANFAVHSDKDVTDLGNLIFSNDLNLFQHDYANIVCSALDEYSTVVAMGGGHDIAFGSFMGLDRYLALQNETKSIGIINFDAHFDLRIPAPYTSSGTPFYQISEYVKHQNKDFNYACIGVAQTANTQALFERAQALNVRYVTDKQSTFENIVECIAPLLEKVDQLYVTVCLDVFPPELTPGVSAPSTMGVSFQTVLKTLSWLQQKQSAFNYQWRLIDVAEMNPDYDQDNRTAKAAARLIYEVLDER